MRCVVFELPGGHMCPPGRAKVAQTPGGARVKRFNRFSVSIVAPLPIEANLKGRDHVTK